MANFSQAKELPSNEEILHQAKLLNMDPDFLEAIYQQHTHKNQNDPKYYTITGKPQLNHLIYVSYKGNIYWVIVRSDHFSRMSGIPNPDIVQARIEAYPLPNADPKTFVDLGFGYAKDKHQVYTMNKVLENADSQTFQVLNPYYVKDTHFVYFRSISFIDVLNGPNMSLSGAENERNPTEMRVIREADPVTFNAIEQESVSRPNFYYAKDRQHVYFAGEIILEATPSTFSIFTEQPAYSTDNRSIYIRGKPCSIIDPHSFEAMSDLFTRDKNHVYMACKVINGLDAQSFEFLNDTHHSPLVFKDKNSVYWVETTYSSEEIDLIDWEKKKIPEADPKTFSLLIDSYNQKGPYGRDKKHVYYYEKPVLGADPKTFQVLRDDSYGVDQKKIYQFGEPLSLEDFKNNLYGIVENLSEDKLYQISVQYLSRMLNQKDDDAAIYYSFRADMYAAQGHLKKAINDYKSAIHLLKKQYYKDDEIFEIYLKIISLYINLKNYNLAHSSILQAENFINQDSPCNDDLDQLHELKAEIHVARRKVANALKIYHEIKNRNQACFEERGNNDVLEWMQTIDQKIKALEK